MIQNQPISFTGADVAWIVTLLLAIGNLIILVTTQIEKYKNKKNMPEQAQNERIDRLEDRLVKVQDDLMKNTDAFNDRFDKVTNKYDELIEHYRGTRDRHDKEIETLSEGQIILAKAVRNMTEHFIHDNNYEGMKNSANELEEFIYTQAQHKKDLINED